MRLYGNLIGLNFDESIDLGEFPLLGGSPKSSWTSQVSHVLSTHRIKGSSWSKTGLMCIMLRKSKMKSLKVVIFEQAGP